jgi:hypothetical protein
VSRPVQSAVRAISLAETAVAGSLLCLLLITVLNLFPAALAAVGSSKQTHTADTLAQNALETFAARPFSGLALGAQSNEGIAMPQGFTLQVEIQPVDGYSTEYLKKVKATVSWTYRQQNKAVMQELYVQAVD